jgi:spore maturation protein CgeB
MYEFPCDVKALVYGDKDFRLIATKGYERILAEGHSFSDRVTLMIDELLKISATT